MKNQLGAVAFSLLAFAATPVFCQSFDLVIKNGRVMDPETGFDQVVHVGITDGKIASITEDEISGSEEIDATGHVVAPGFIDYHRATHKARSVSGSMPVTV